MVGITRRQFGKILGGGIAGLALARCGGSISEPLVPTFDQNVLRVYSPGNGLDGLLGVTENGTLGLFENHNNQFSLSEVLDYNGMSVNAVMALNGRKKVIVGLQNGEIRVYARDFSGWSLDQTISHEGIKSGPGFVTGLKTFNLDGEQYVVAGVQAPVQAKFSGHDSFAERGSFSEDESYSFGTGNIIPSDFATGGGKSLQPYNKIFRVGKDSLEELTFDEPWRQLLEAGNAQTYAFEPFFFKGTLMLFIANDFADDHLFAYGNDGFREIPLPLNETGHTFSMGATVCANEDGTSSIYVTDLNRVIEYVVDSNGVRLHREIKFKEEPDPSPGSITAWPVQKVDGRLVVGFGGIWPGHDYSEGNKEISKPGIMIFDRNVKSYHATESDVHQMTIMQEGSRTYVFTQRFPSMPDDGSLVGVYTLAPK